jgi:PERQ amino acid-rich with GYF domain-containing protein
MPFGGQAGWYGNQGFRPPQPQQQMQPPQQIQQQMPEGNDPFASTPIDNQYQQQQPVAEPAPQETVQQQTSPVKQPAAVVAPTPAQPPAELEPEIETVPEETVTPVQPATPASAWGQAAKTPSQPPSRKPSIVAPGAPVVSPKKVTTSLAREPSPAPIVEETPAPAPAPARVASPPAPKQDKPAPITLSNVIDKAISPSPATATAAGPKAAPWAQKDEKEKAGPSLRQIQEAEAKQAETRRAARAAAQLQAQQAAAYGNASSEDLPASMAWGLASSGSGKATASNPALASPSVATPPAAVWGGGDAAAPKKTLKQIQEEEEKRAKAQKAKAASVSAAAVSAASGSNGSAVPKRGYADLAAAPAAPVPGWSTVGAGGKPIPGAAPKAAAPAPAAPLLRSTSTAASARPASAAGTARSNGPAASASLDDTYTPSLDFIKWAKTALSGLRTPVDEFLQICLSFPIDPPGVAKAEGAEIISEMVYANSGTLDGRRFAADFFDKRKADAKKQAQDKANAAKSGWTTMSSASATQANLADVVKSVQSKKEDTGFKVVKAKGKKK